ncbi:hypothetical protein PEL8287_03254 [Roseovarius litorisediminis]|uniref:Uncharacterized protein n=1 Tax=Roseovarius litorisediminis TaxID=1312363 RepID=A0A1Y5TB31_9RHOB|nr:hypothetical protein [Roseovarius litorisediminis]SLN60048.1 hypothetical protein PEL8287_03254 [Roseovarius litorisediminis]
MLFAKIGSATSFQKKGTALKRTYFLGGFAFCFALSVTANLAQSHEISGLQSAVSAHIGMSQSRCAEISQQACSSVFGSCSNYNDGAVGTARNMTISYTCQQLVGNLRILQQNAVALSPATLEDLDRLLRGSMAYTAPYFE